MDIMVTDITIRGITIHFITAAGAGVLVALGDGPILALVFMPVMVVTTVILTHSMPDTTMDIGMDITAEAEHIITYPDRELHPEPDIPVHMVIPQVVVITLLPDLGLHLQLNQYLQQEAAIQEPHLRIRTDHPITEQQVKQL
jgi:hypothetical protein